MPLWKRPFLIVPSIILLFVSTIGSGMRYPFMAPPTEKEASSSSLHNAAVSLAEYARNNNMDDQLFLLVDMRLPSGKNRFFVYDNSQDSILMSGLVSHGKGNGQWQLCPRFSNEIGSSCTSLGRYRIGSSYVGKFGLSYRLFGLDSSNSNAFSRSIVLHSHESIPDQEVDPAPINQSEGCPTVSPAFLTQLDKLLKSRKKPVLLYIFS